ncbi:proton channel OTOP3-like isoform X2 [Thunnus maccoyii]|uniref:proton channel OTOP3-like isoform X2 n=1 Tax=Thunnus maccoyii TaxID=8240 RepID=UPI001C4C0F54|nr:proton channel OTOP3-like isoform X2 [Thunnus maccoyii]
MLILSADLLLWLNAVTEDSIHEEIELEREDSNTSLSKADMFDLATIGQLALSYFSLVAALAVGTQGPLGELDLSYSLLSLMELILQNIFIIKGLHRHPKLLAKKERSSIFKPKKKVIVPVEDKGKTDISVLDASAPPVVQAHAEKKSWTKRVIEEICAFLILSNTMVMSCLSADLKRNICIFKNVCNTSTFPPLPAVGHPCVWSPPSV